MTQQQRLQDLIQYLLGQTVVEATAKVTTLDKRGPTGSSSAWTTTPSASTA